MTPSVVKETMCGSRSSKHPCIRIIAIEEDVYMVMFGDLNHVIACTTAHGVSPAVSTPCVTVLSYHTVPHHAVMQR